MVNAANIKPASEPVATEDGNSKRSKMVAVITIPTIIMWMLIAVLGGYEALGLLRADYEDIVPCYDSGTMEEYASCCRVTTTAADYYLGDSVDSESSHHFVSSCDQIRTGYTLQVIDTIC